MPSKKLSAKYFWREGYWVRTSVRVELEREEKILIGKPSSPRWELDIVAYSGREHSLRVVECKSYLDSRGVILRALDGTDEKSARLYKLFNDERLRQVVFAGLRRQLVKSGACPPDTSIKLCLACGRIATERDRAGLRNLFLERGWELWDESWLRDKLMAMSKGGYDNQVAAVVSKLLLRRKLD